jgi:hypothetical protein
MLTFNFTTNKRTITNFSQANLHYGWLWEVNLHPSILAMEHGSHDLTEMGSVKENILLCEQIGRYRDGERRTVRERRGI